MSSFSSYLPPESTTFISDQLARVLSAWDYVMLVLFLIVSLAVGIVVSLIGKRNDEGERVETDTEEFLMGSRKMQYLPVALSLLVSFNSAILILGGPTDTYNNGTMYLYSVLAEMIAVVLAAVVFVPVFYNLYLTSSFEYLEMRFGSRFVRLMGDFLLILNNIVYMGMALYSPSTAMSYVTNGALSTEWSIAISGVVCLVYTAWGGIKAVIWTDVFQSVVMTGGILAIIIKGLIDIGGFGEMWNLALKYDRIEFDNFAFNPTIRHTFWGLVIGNGIGYTGTFGVTQAAVQRYCSVPTLRKAQLSVILACLGAGVFVASTVLAGLVIFGYYAQKACDPIAGGIISDDNQIVPYFVMETLNYPPIPGIFVASLFAGAMSSVSSSLSALSAITWQDMLKPYCFTKVSETTATWINRGSIVVYGIVSILMGFAVSNLGGTVLQASLGFTGAIGAPLTGLFALGILVPFANKYGALAGSVIGLALSGWLSVGAYVHGKQLVARESNITMCPTPPPPTATMLPTTPAPTEPPIPLDGWYSISYEWWSVIGILGTLLPGIIVSLATFGWREPVQESLINPYLLKLYKWIGCSNNYSSNLVNPVEEEINLEGVKSEKAALGLTGSITVDEQPSGYSAASRSSSSVEIPEPSATPSDAPSYRDADSSTRDRELQTTSADGEAGREGASNTEVGTGSSDGVTPSAGEAESCSQPEEAAASGSGADAAAGDAADGSPASGASGLDTAATAIENCREISM